MSNFTKENLDSLINHLEQKVDDVILLERQKKELEDDVEYIFMKIHYQLYGDVFEFYSYKKSIMKFIYQLGFEETTLCFIYAIKTILNKDNRDFSEAFKYFCGICYRKINEQK